VTAHERVYGRISFVTGTVTLVVAGLWFWRSWDEGLALPPAPTGDLTDLGALYTFWLIALAFEFGVPSFCLVSTLFGFPARREMTSRIGLSCALAALLMYAIYVRSCSAALFG